MLRLCLLQLVQVLCQNVEVVEELLLLFLERRVLENSSHTLAVWDEVGVLVYFKIVFY